jgi:hypothetical protein
MALPGEEACNDNYQLEVWRIHFTKCNSFELLLRDWNLYRELERSQLVVVI